MSKSDVAVLDNFSVLRMKEGHLLSNALSILRMNWMSFHWLNVHNWAAIMMKSVIRLITTAMVKWMRALWMKVENIR